ncbi:MAG: ABC transporter permease subunit [Alphaproteobacteria bacterium]
MSKTFIIMKRELASYFATPLAYVFIVIFLFLAGVFTFYLGLFIERDQADLRAFFDFHPWLYLLLMPAISMRLWAEERKAGTIEFLMSLPVPFGATVLGKFLAAWAFTAIALSLTFPIWITVNYLGDPDNGIIFAGYVGSLIMAGGYLAISSCISAITKNQVIAFVTGVVVCFIFTISGQPLVTDFFSAWAPQWVVELIASFSFSTHFEAIVEGVIDIRDVIYFSTLIGLFLYANAVVIEFKKAS